MMARVWLRFCLATLLVVGATACSDEASSPAGGDAGDADVPVSEGPATLPDGQMAVVGKAYDYLTGAPVAGAFVSTFPPTVIVRTNADGYLTMNYAGVTPVLVEAVKELKRSSTARLAEKDAEIEALRARLSRLEAMLDNRR